MWLKRPTGLSTPNLHQLGRLESRLMERIWARGEVSVRDLHAELASRSAYTTIMTTLVRLFMKGLLSRRKVGKAFYYTATLNEQEYKKLLTRHLFGMVLNDGKDSNVVLSEFVDTVSETDHKMLEQLDQLVKAKKRALKSPALG
jgi:predicted transcriptional regulator